MAWLDAPWGRVADSASCATPLVLIASPATLTQHVKADSPRTCFNTSEDTTEVTASTQRHRAFPSTTPLCLGGVAVVLWCDRAVAMTWLC